MIHIFIGTCEVQHNENKRTIKREYNLPRMPIFIVQEAQDWQELAQRFGGDSLFAEPVTIDIRLLKAPNVDQQRLLAQLLTSISSSGSDQVWLTANFAKAKDKWILNLQKQIGNQEVSRHVATDLSISAQRQWLERYANTRNVSLPMASIDMLADMCQGNLVVAANHIDMLALSDDATDVPELSDVAQFSFFSIFETVLRGNSHDTLRVLKQTLKQHSNAPIPFTRQLATHIAKLIQLAAEQGDEFTARNLGFWGASGKLAVALVRQPWVSITLLERMQARLATLERAAMGQSEHDIELELVNMFMALNAVYPTRIPKF